MKAIILIFTLFSLITSHKLKYKTPVSNVVKCLLKSEVLVDDVAKVIELIEKKEFVNLISELISMYPKAYEEVKRCLNVPSHKRKKEQNAIQVFKGRKCYMKKNDIVAKCCFVDKRMCSGIFGNIPCCINKIVRYKPSYDKKMRYFRRKFMKHQKNDFNDLFDLLKNF